MAQSYTGPIFSGQPDWARVPIARLESFHWEKESPYRPASFAQLCAVRGEGIFVRMWSFESPIRAVAAKRDDPVYQDMLPGVFFESISGPAEFLYKF